MTVIQVLQRTPANSSRAHVLKQHQPEHAGMLRSQSTSAAALSRVSIMVRDEDLTSNTHS